MIVAITGGRDHRVTHTELIAFNVLRYELHITVLAHGAARGVDTDVSGHVKRMWPRSIKVVPYAVDEAKDGKWPAAGCRRNGRMLRESGAQALIAFKGGNGTADCAQQAIALGLPVHFVGVDGSVETVERGMIRLPG